MGYELDKEVSNFNKVLASPPGENWHFIGMFKLTGEKIPESSEAIS
jgi:hypothetical protein